MEQDKKTHTVIEQVNLETGGLYDFELQAGEVVRLRYTGNGKWANPTTGESLERAPAHQNYAPVAGLDYVKHPADGGGGAGDGGGGTPNCSNTGGCQ